MGTGHFEGDVHPMGLSRENAEDVEHPTHFLLKARSHFVKLVQPYVTPCVDSGSHQQHTPHFHATLNGAGDVPHSLLNVANCSRSCLVAHRELLCPRATLL